MNKLINEGAYSPKKENKSTFILRSYEEMQKTLEESEKNAKKERDEFLDAWLATAVRYNIK